MRAKFLSNFLLNDFRGILRATGKTIKNCRITPREMAVFMACIEHNLFTRATVRQILTELIRQRNDSLKGTS